MAIPVNKGSNRITNTLIKVLLAEQLIIRTNIGDKIITTAKMIKIIQFNKTAAKSVNKSKNMILNGSFMIKLTQSALINIYLIYFMVFLFLCLQLNF
jgi:hypothetical protein